MKNPLQTPFAAVFWNEALLNSKRVAPYIVAALCGGHAVLWWSVGPARGRGVAVNSDFAMAAVFAPYSFLFLPLFTALIMADPSIRDFMTSFVVALNVLLRNKYVAYVIATGTGGALFYLYNIGYNHWLYNPLFYGIWKYADLTSPITLARRPYWLGLAVVCLAPAHVSFERKSR